MLEALNGFDTQLLLYLNNCHTQFWDNFMWLFTSRNIWIPFYTIILIYIIKRYKWQATITMIFIALIIVLADQIASGICKPLFQRLRPSQEPALEGLVMLVNNKRGGLYGFISSHAANSFAFAGFSIFLFKNKAYTFLILFWAILNSYTRIYLGLHYPADIIVGATLGIFIGYAVYKMYVYVLTTKYIQKLRLKGVEEFTVNDIRNISASLILSIFIILIASKVMIA